MEERLLTGQDAVDRVLVVMSAPVDRRRAVGVLHHPQSVDCLRLLLLLRLRSPSDRYYARTLLIDSRPAHLAIPWKVLTVVVVLLRLAGRRRRRAVLRLRAADHARPDAARLLVAVENL